MRVPCNRLRHVTDTGMRGRRVESFRSLAEWMHARPGGVGLVGVDGYGGAGKSTFVARLAAALAGPPSCIPTTSRPESPVWSGGRGCSER